MMPFRYVYRRNCPLIAYFFECTSWFIETLQVMDRCGEGAGIQFGRGWWRKIDWKARDEGDTILRYFLLCVHLSFDSGNNVEFAFYVSDNSSSLVYRLILPFKENTMTDWSCTIRIQTFLLCSGFSCLFFGRAPVEKKRPSPVVPPP